MSKSVSYKIQKRLGWNYNLPNSLEITERENTPITIQFIEETVYCGDCNSSIFETPLEVQDV